MAEEPLSNGQMQDESQPKSVDFHDRTFMGGIGLATRTSLFVIFGLVVLGCAGLGLFFVDRELAKADDSLKQAVELDAFAAEIERDVWRIRAESGELSKRMASRKFPTSDAEIAATQEHVALANGVGQRLDELYQRPDSVPIGEQVSTLREAVAQYMEQYDKSSKEEGAPEPDLTGRESSLRQSLHAISKILADVNILSLNETMTEIRVATTEFIESGAGRDLIAIENNQNEFVRLLNSVPIAEEDKTALRQGLTTLTFTLTAYAKVRVVRDHSRDRLEEIVSYMTPSVDVITEFTGHNLVQIEAQRQSLRHDFRIYIAAGVAGSILFILLFGILVMRSVSGPAIAAGEAARKLKTGNTDIVVLGLGNEDETGDIARAFWDLKGRLAEANKLRDTMKKAKAEAERGRAASAEAEWLRRDLESMKVDADKGKDALAEVALLRKIIDATADNVGKHQIAENAETTTVADQKAPAAPQSEAYQELSLDSISSISRQVAQSSENVTAAADEAERTGTLIRNLSDAGEKIDAIEGLIAAIGEQADMLVVNAPLQGPDTNLVILNGDADRGDQGRPDGITRRFDAIRSAAGQATWAIRDIATLIRESREVALKIARLSSTEALEVTTDLLQQSENLRGMLDKLVNRMQDQITDNVKTPKEEDGPTIA
jgi:methyl-accepting chemotaxis protein